MAGVSMVFPPPDSLPEYRPDSDLHGRKHCSELPMAPSVQPPKHEGEILIVIMAILSLSSAAYFVLTGSDLALAIWLFFAAALWII